jgi:hypothetical protein
METWPPEHSGYQGKYLPVTLPIHRQIAISGTLLSGSPKLASVFLAPSPKKI